MTAQTKSSKVNRNHQWWVGIVAGMASYIDACAIVSSGAALAIYQQLFGLSNMEFGVLSASLTFAIAIGALCGGRLGDRFGRKHVFSVTMVLIVIGAGILVLTTSFVPLLLGMVLMGAGTGADLPVSLATIAETADEKNRGKLIGLSNVLWLVGIIGAISVGSIVGEWGRLGGQIMFGQVAIVALIVLLLRLTIPESASWIHAHEERQSGVNTVRASRASVKDLFAPEYIKPFIALIGFYALVNLAANTQGQFGNWVAVNVIGISVADFSRIGLLMFPIGIISSLVFMAIVDTKWRMPLFYVGALLYIGGFAILVIFGFTVPTLIAMMVINGIGSAFAFEGIMKVWSQESFPTLLRTTAQGTVVAVARFLAAIVGMFTASLISISPRGAYLGLVVLTAVGYAFAIWGFKGKQHSEFKTETQIESSSSAERENSEQLPSAI